MGLDQWAVAYKYELKKNGSLNTTQTTFSQWRKHPNLHGYIENLYRSKFPESKEVFNCIEYEFSEEDIDNLEKAIENNELPHTTGFFFGQSRDTEKEKDIEFIKKAREYMKEGCRICYNSWW